MYNNSIAVIRNVARGLGLLSLRAAQLEEKEEEQPDDEIPTRQRLFYYSDANERRAAEAGKHKSHESFQ